jgi:hypothetical protein
MQLDMMSGTSKKESLRGRLIPPYIIITVTVQNVTSVIKGHAIHFSIF